VVGDGFEQRGFGVGGRDERTTADDVGAGDVLVMAMLLGGHVASTSFDAPPARL
jgi:hypothetical protein